MLLADLITENKNHFTIADYTRVWKEINQVCFDGELSEPKIFLDNDLSHLVDDPKYFDRFENGQIIGYCDEDPDDHEIVLLFWNGLSDPREMIQVVAHEMVHQALAEKYSYEKMLKLGHGPEFMSYSNTIKAYHNIELFGASYNETT